ncbi:MAG: hypothetical protein AAFX93_15870 [Verrucomicrobiota bacterium]
MEVDEQTQLIRTATILAQQLIRDLHDRDPKNPTFDQAGLMDGELTVLDYIDHNESGAALEHLLYMIHESDIDFPRGRVEAVHELAQEWKIRNPYTAQNIAKLNAKERESTYNVI